MITMRDASNALLSPRNDSVPAERPSAGGCSPRDVVPSDASNALAPRAAFASAAGNFDEDFFRCRCSWRFGKLRGQLRHIHTAALAGYGVPADPSRLELQSMSLTRRARV